MLNGPHHPPFWLHMAIFKGGNFYPEDRKGTIFVPQSKHLEILKEKRGTTMVVPRQSYFCAI